MAEKMGILGRKLGMTRIFAGDGSAVAVTVVQAGPCPVTQVKTAETDGYNALQIAFEEAKEKHVTKPMKGHFAKAGASLASELDLSRYQVMRMLATLEDDGFISRKTFGKVCTLITVVNWQLYQSATEEAAQQPHNERTSSAQVPHTIEEGKKARKEIPPASADAAEELASLSGKEKQEGAGARTGSAHVTNKAPRSAASATGSLGLAEDPSNFAISCSQVGPIEIPAKLPKQANVFRESTSVFFKATRVTRIWDAKRNTLVYLAVSRRLVDGSPFNAISTVPRHAGARD